MSPDELHNHQLYAAARPSERDQLRRGVLGDWEKQSATSWPAVNCWAADVCAEEPQLPERQWARAIIFGAALGFVALAILSQLGYV